MIFRTTTIYTVVCAMLLCPYLCLARAVDECGETPAKDCYCQDTDDCCPADSSEQGQDRPSSKDCCTQSGMCLCHGAILEHSTVPADIDAGIVAHLLLDTLPIVNESLVVDNSFLQEHAACHFASVQSGRKVRALIESFLI